MSYRPCKRRRERWTVALYSVVVGFAGWCIADEDSSANTTTLLHQFPNNNSASFYQELDPFKPVLSISGMYDIKSFAGWPEHLLKFTVHLINNHTDGWYDDVLTDATLNYTMSDSACDPDVATRAYLNMTRSGNAPDAIFGCRCSGASVAVARLAAVENIPMLSPASSSTKLSNKDEYPTFSRLFAPDDDTGQVGALISLLRSFGWDKISVINTDTQFTKDIALELSSAWKGEHFGNDPFVGEIAYADTIKLDSKTDLIDYESAIRVLNAVPVDNPSANSRVIVLFAHHQHAFPILRAAQELNFQSDTIWIGTSEWAGRRPLENDTSWMPPIPGYLGIVPHRNLTTPMYTDYLSRLQDYEKQRNLPVTSELYDYVADRIADGILALAMAFSAVPPNLRTDGLRVARALRRIDFEGISGRVAFDENGDLREPVYSVKTLTSPGTEWIDVGTVSTKEGGNNDIDFSRICFPVAGCNLENTPDDEYDVAKELLPFWIWIVLALLCILVVLFYHQRVKNKSVTQQLRRIEDELKALDNNDTAVRQKKGKLYKEIASLLGQPKPSHWTKRNGLVKVPPTQQEYWDVLAKLRETIDDTGCHLSSLSRVQNMGIWSYYVFRKNQLANKYKVDMNHSTKVNECSVWHGTSSLNPDVIYKDSQDGFMMQLSQQGHWGRGIYFSERAGYSDPYSFKPFNKYTDTIQQDRELYLVKLLVGEEIFLDRNTDEYMREACKGLLAPPDNPDRPGLKFDTVSGLIDDEKNTKVYVVYENGRAYPEYLVRYYKGERDPERTPYESLDEAIHGEASKPFMPPDPESALTELAEDDISVTSHRSECNALWEFEEGDSGWVQYQSAHQIQLEEAYQRDPEGVTTIEHFPWTYAVDMSVNLQTNLDHPDKTSRRIRRVTLQLGDNARDARMHSTIESFDEDNEEDRGINDENSKKDENPDSGNVHESLKKEDDERPSNGDNNDKIGKDDGHDETKESPDNSPFDIESNFMSATEETYEEKIARKLLENS